jgi:sulfatase maturation enzyme AslB (radical SAM superfamily)
MISSRSHGVPGSPDRYSAPRRLTERVGRRFHVMAKPAGSACNLECGYCFYLSKQNLPGGPGGGHMDDDLVDLFVRDYIQSVTADEVSSPPAYCRKCEFLRDCWGECPKNRVLRAPDGEPGLNYLCSGLKRFFAHAVPEAGRIAARLGAPRSGGH